MKISVAALSGLVSLAACGPGNLDGSVQGHKINLHSAVFARYTMTGYVVGSSTPVLAPAVDAIITDDPKACATLKSGIPYGASHTYVFMHLNQDYYTRKGASAVPEVAPGYYSAQNPMVFDSGKQGGTALFYFKAPGCPADAAELDLAPYGLDGGILVNDIATSAGGLLTGDIDVKFGAHGDALKGTVHMTYCDAFETYLKRDLDPDPARWDCN